MDDPDTQHIAFCEAITTKDVRCRRNGTRVDLGTGRVRWTCKEHHDPHLRFSTDDITSTMSEQQVDTDTDDTEPTPGPAWAEGTHIIASSNDGRPNGEVILGPRSYGNDISGDEQRANAELCAAAFTAASELPEEYDPVGAVKALPALLEVAKEALQEMRWIVEGGSSSRIPTEDEAAARHMLAEVLHAVRKDTTQTDE